MPPITTPNPLPPLEVCRCGYNLRGLSASGRCPECGTRIELALERMRKPVAATEARLARWGCGCFLLSIFLLHYEWFVSNINDESPRLLAATAMTVGSWLFALAQGSLQRHSADTVHGALFRGVVVAWLIIAVLVQPGWLASGITAYHVRLPLLLLPIASLYFMLSALSRWHCRLGGLALSRAIRLTAWIFPIVLLCYRPSIWRVVGINTLGTLLNPAMYLIVWCAMGLFFVVAFLIGITWYASLDTGNESRPEGR